MKKILTLCLAAMLFAFAGSAHADSLSISIGTPPPPVREEVITTAPGPEAEWAWHAGHWRWVDETHVWIPGHWVRRPHPGAVWVEPRWEQRSSGWVFIEGRWK